MPRARKKCRAKKVSGVPEKGMLAHNRMGRLLRAIPGEKKRLLGNAEESVRSGLPIHDAVNSVNMGCGLGRRERRDLSIHLSAFVPTGK